MSKNNAKILLVLLAAIFLGGAYMYIYKDNMDKKKSADSECTKLEKRYKELKAKEDKRDVYEAEITQYSKEVLKTIEKYPVSLDQEDIILLVKGFLEDNKEGKIDVENIALNLPVEYYTISGIMDESGNFNEGYTCYSVDLPLPYTGTYQGVKDFIDYVQKYDKKISIVAANLSPSDIENDEYSGSLQLKLYNITGPGRVEEEIEVPGDINNGVDNIFVGGANANPVKVYTHDYDNGESIKIDNDFTIVLNNANNDLADGIIVSAASSDSQISDGANKVVKVDVTVTQKDDAYEYTYAIGDSKYTGEVKGKDLTIYVNSSERVDNADSNGVELNIKNATELPVFVKVSGDDTTAPRFNLGNKEGTVKVY